MARMYQKSGRGGLTEQEYMDRRSWLIDTAETPEDKKNLKRDLKILDDYYKLNKRSGNPVYTDPNFYKNPEKMIKKSSPKNPTPKSKKVASSSKPLPVKGKTPTRSGPQGNLKKKK